MLFLMVFGRYPEKFSLGIFFSPSPDYRSNTIRLICLFCFMQLYHVFVGIGTEWLR